uniref:FERM domain-containing protein n=1 Tax=Caenorhabditis japonica TaxID=281687 RepID=A0A8R1DM06_CAEJA
MGKDREPVDQQHHPPPATSPAPSQHPRDPKMQAARVRLPYGVYKEFEVNRGSEGEALFRQVTSGLSIEESEYFSLCFYDNEEGIRYWLYNDKQLKNLPWEFSFEVKFYPTTIVDHARYYVFLQLCPDILTGRLPAAADTHALLGSFVGQIEFGDAPAQVNDDYEKFIVGARLVPTEHSNAEVSRTERTDGFGGGDFVPGPL